MSRRGETYSLTYDDSDLPGHYGWKPKSRVKAIEQHVQKVQSSPVPPQPEPAATPDLQTVRQVIDGLDSEGRWVSTFAGERLVGQVEMPVGTKYLSSQVFSDNLAILSGLLKSGN